MPFENDDHKSKHLISQTFLRKVSDEIVSRNERRVLDFIRRNPDETRARIMHELDLSAQSVSRLTDTLRSRGLVEFGDRVISGRGQPSIALRLNRAAAFSFGVSIMSDAITTALMDFNGDIVHRGERVMAKMSRDAVLSATGELLSEALTASEAEPHRLFGIGIAFSGFFVGQGRRMNPVPALEELALVDLEALFADRFNVPVWVDNDGNAAAVGESLVGVGKRARHFAYLYFTAGFGGGVVIDGKPFRGMAGNAGEFGAILPPEKHEERPTLELLRQMVAEEGGPAFETLSQMLAAFDADWPGVENWIRHVTPQISLVASAICAVIDPEVIVLGGSMPEALGNRLIPEIRINNFVRRDLKRPEPDIIVSVMQANATAIGAAALPLKETFFF